MDLEFEKAVYKYYCIVKEKCELLINHILLSEQVLLRDKYELYAYIKKKRRLDFCFDNNNYIFHGCGCTVYFRDVIVADWDFGYRSLWCGIDAYKMSLTLKNNKYENNKYHDADYINMLCKLYASMNEVLIYKNQYYINLLRKGTIRTSFPENYNKMIIKYSMKEKCFNRSKEIDRFLRKSREIYMNIDELDNNYLLIFMDMDKEVYRINYNDIAYPDSAVDIMNGRILRPHEIEYI